MASTDARIQRSSVTTFVYPLLIFISFSIVSSKLGRGGSGSSESLVPPLIRYDQLSSTGSFCDQRSAEGHVANVPSARPSHAHRPEQSCYWVHILLNANPSILRI
ncbi:hypothetical protein SODALDRAFT_324670 [Sodiomyces alkalinus F11]|uniref:Uncharacterized protein n=1 Tax=Sodiomyces alkalinus (strain CBS 110278 / VKM F-3762 / F11) TaxID=1314773 RepID=A0A3N2PUY2_SODAK|nr:hypothetical protein SODALDRAFT_324670 [Sodiomyces alkalinus F11]ROT38288.1 hypothetical protein SODALDRAFT_324670 [Sodiomyces alkalinus F11]